LPDYGLIYCSEALPEDLTIVGEVRVTLPVQSDCPDTDVVDTSNRERSDGRSERRASRATGMASDHW